MDLTTCIEPVTSLKTETAKLILQAQKTGQPIVITQSGKPTAVLIDVETYQTQQNALMLLKILAQGDTEWRDGKCITQDKAEQKIGQILKKLAANDVVKT
jgi:prevent-host-death family protein